MAKLFLFAVVCLIITAFVKNAAPQFSAGIRLAVGVAVLVASLTFVQPVSDYLSSFALSGSIDSAYIKLAVKITGISVISQSVADICRDSNETALATQVELLGRVMMLAVSMPVVKLLVQMCSKMIL